MPRYIHINGKIVKGITDESGLTWQSGLSCNLPVCSDFPFRDLSNDLPDELIGAEIPL